MLLEVTVGSASVACVRIVVYLIILCPLTPLVYNCVMCIAPLWFDLDRMCLVNRDRFLSNADDLGELNIIPIGCGCCIECRSAKALEWTRRLELEKMSSRSLAYFLTLTFDDEHCPDVVSKRDVSAFMKRLRKVMPSGVRFFACGEYGDHTGRPHYHVILFNALFDDLRPLNNCGLYTSSKLATLWPFGLSSIAHADSAAMAYVARYVVKKVAISDNSFVLMSRRPGIGVAAFEHQLSSVVSTNRCYGPSGDFPIPRSFRRRLPVPIEIALTSENVVNAKSVNRTDCAILRVSSSDDVRFRRRSMLSPLSKRGSI